MIFGKIWRSIQAQFNKLANAIRGIDPIAEMQYEYDRSVIELRRAARGWPSIGRWSSGSPARSTTSASTSPCWRPRSRAYLKAGDRETAGPHSPWS